MSRFSSGYVVGLQEGLKIGNEQGEKRGTKKGIIIEKRCLAEKMLKRGLDIKTISLGTGLDIAQINSIKNSIETAANQPKLVSEKKAVREDEKIIIKPYIPRYAIFRQFLIYPTTIPLHAMIFFGYCFFIPMVLAIIFLNVLDFFSLYDPWESLLGVFGEDLELGITYFLITCFYLYFHAKFFFKKVDHFADKTQYILTEKELTIETGAHTTLNGYFVDTKKILWSDIETVEIVMQNKLDVFYGIFDIKITPYAVSLKEELTLKHVQDGDSLLFLIKEKSQQSKLAC